MSFLHTLIVVLQVLSALGVIVLVLLQHGKGADMGAAFGSGASGSLFGATGSANFLSRVTAALATVFFLSTLGLVFVTNKAQAPASVMEQPVAPGVDPSIPQVSTPAPSVPPAPVPAGESGAAAQEGAAPASAPSAPATEGSAEVDAAQKNSGVSEIPK